MVGRLRRLLRRTAGQGESVGLLIIDVDRFKGINDRYGHGAGDQVLVDFAQRLITAVRPTDTVGRWGGEEFLAVLPGAGPVLAERAEQIRAAVADTPFLVAGDELCLHASIGGAVAERTGAPATTGSGGRARREVDALIGAADRALYAAKAAGRDRVVIAGAPALR